MIIKQQLPIEVRPEAADSITFEAQCRIQDPIYGCVGLLYFLQQQIHIVESQVAKAQAEISVFNSQSHQPHEPLQPPPLQLLQQFEPGFEVSRLGFEDRCFRRMMKPIFCGNFEYDARQSDLERLFRRYGKVDRVDMKSGFAFIYMEDERDADDAIRGLDRTEFGRKGRRLRVEWTKHERGIRRPGSGGASRRPAANTRPSKTLFVINFDPFHTRTRDLERHFEPYGKIVSVRIRRNFAFVQYEVQEDATRALETTNMSKLMDRVISVEYAVRDDDDRKNGYSPDRGRDRSPDRGGRRRSPSPYRRERGSPDYGRGPSRSPYRRERGSPDYGRGRSHSPSYRRDRGSPDYGRGTSQSPYRKERGGADQSPYRKERGGAEQSPYRKERAGVEQSPYRKERGVAERSPYRKERGDAEQSPYRKERGGAEHGQGPSRSPYRRERASAENGRVASRSPYRREKPSPDNGRNPSHSPYGRERPSSDNCRGGSRSPYGRERASPDNGRASSPNLPDPKDSPGYVGGDSPINDRYRSRSPPADD
ncbi:hypothetical protein QYF36_014173 [Acer negundo]|nr:hypothetical protein QYF36_014173 [Acer negundo]